MATLIKQFTFVAETDILPNQVNANFDDMYTFINNSVVHVDGSKAMTAALTLPAADPTSDNQAARKAYVDARVATRADPAAVTAAQTTANAALPATHINGGLVMNTQANGAGDISIPHGLGAVPRSVVVIPYLPGGVSAPWSMAVENRDAANFNIRVYHDEGTNVSQWPGITISFFWIALR